ncbi:hypothetical protein VSS37_03780 [Candidatus Thiothrix sp. Deng01]|uniref:Uncharacterized protein n=1 Tax=Candidatus Thiothrix phosphatis TaxID=3112415 RepID=A0ABU6CU13_9GAMM|nr:hypothetical protein [Candidatus Thiothrix sp. Deng01]MEB4590091.1 hypothetical protein [Candidatus Thiothrix sp. Deng01]
MSQTELEYQRVRRDEEIARIQQVYADNMAIAAEQFEEQKEQYEKLMAHFAAIRDRETMAVTERYGLPG